MNSWFSLVKSCGIPWNPQNPLGIPIRLRCRGALQCVSSLRTAPATLGAALCGADPRAWGRSLGRGEESRAGLPKGTSWDENSDGTPESNGTKGCLAKFAGCHIPHFPGKSDNNSPFSARCSIVGGFHMTAQASQLRGLAVDSDYSGWSSRGISLWQAACNVPLWTCLLGIPSRPRMV